MNTIQELEKQLELAKQEAKNKERQEIIRKAEEAYLNKCYSSHLFQRVPKPGKTVTIRKITRVKLDRDDRLNYEGEQLEFHNWDGARFDVSINKISTHEPFPTWISSWSHEIPVELFDSIAEQIKAHASTYFDVLSEIFKKENYITNGDSNDESVKVTYVKKYFNLLEVPEKVFQILTWERHPFLYEGNLFLNTLESIQIIRDIIEKLNKSAQEWGGQIAERDYEQARVLSNFIKTLQ